MTGRKFRQAGRIVEKALGKREKLERTEEKRVR
jgi:hypothetical protein